MAGGRRGGSNQFTDLRLRLEVVEGGVRITLTRGDNAFFAAGTSTVTPTELSKLAETNPQMGADRAKVHAIGCRLGSICFPSDVERALCGLVRTDPIRLRIQADANLAAVPWEMAVLPGLGATNEDFIALNSRFSLTRDVQGKPIESRAPNDLPTVLVAWANPGSPQYPRLHFAEKEAASVVRALKSAECRSIHVDELPYATVAGLLRSLADRRPDVLHFIGHGDVAPSGGAIVLEGGLPGTHAVLYGDELAQALVNAGTTLTVLSGCLTSGSPEAIGTQLAVKGVPAVLAMSMPIQDAAAHQFARALYSSLAEGTQLEEAMFEGRCAIAGMGSDWAAPQLMISDSKPIVLAEPSVSAPKPQAKERRTNLTYDDRPFIGRLKERADLRRKIRDQGQRLVTITGPGGMGKTRLSRQVAAELLDDFPDGVWFVDCESHIGAQELTSGIASAIPFSAGVESLSSLRESLHRKRALIVLDCFENSVAQGALVEDLLQNTSNLHILVTSRIVLGLPREHEYPLPPMAVFAKAGEASDGVTLFAEAAGHAIDGFQVTAKNRKMLSDLCGSLEGVPLAIVLAAGRLRHMGLAELMRQVREQPVATLRRRSGGVDRHATIESVVAGSFNLLPPAERQVMCKFGVFAGTFTVKDAAFVCNLPDTEVIAWISDLRDHSLVQIQRDEFQTRYKLLDTVRDYVSHLTLEGSLAQELNECRRRHAENFARCAEEIGKLLSEGRWSAGTSAMMQNIGNLRAAIESAVGLQRDDLIATMVVSLARRFFEAGLLTDFRNLADAGYDSADRTHNSSIRIQLLGLDGALASRHGDEPRCETLWLERVALCRREQDMEHCADALIDLAWQAFENRDPAKSRLRLIEALRLARSVNDATFIASARVVQARIAFASSDLRLARLRNSQAAKLLPSCVSRSGSMFVCQILSISCRELGEIDRSVGFTLQLLRMSIERNQVIHAGWALLELAPMYEQTGQMAHAARCYLGAMKVHAEYATRHRTRAATAYHQFKRKHPEAEVSTILAALRSKSWTEIVEVLS